MAIRKTETRLPANIQATDLGESATTSDNKAVLISFISAPLVVGRENTYVVFVTDTSLASNVVSMEWAVSENGATAISQTTDIPEWNYTPLATGSLTLTLKLLGAGNAELASISLTQQVMDLNAELESLIVEARNEAGPGIGNIDVARELVNDHNPYYQSVSTEVPESGDAFKQFVFSITSDGALVRNPAERKRHVQALAAALNNGEGDFASLAAQGVGVCNIRMALLAMILPSGLPWTELPERGAEKAHADGELRQALAALDESKKIDAFNIVRFPKTNIRFCGKVVEKLRDRYFNGTNFSDVMTGMSGTRAHWILKHYNEGPIVHT